MVVDDVVLDVVDEVVLDVVDEVVLDVVDEVEVVLPDVTGGVPPAHLSIHVSCKLFPLYPPNNRCSLVEAIYVESKYDLTLGAVDPVTLVHILVG